MQQLIGKPIDKKNIGLSKLLYGLRQELDIYCLIGINLDIINRRGVGKLFFGHIQKLALDSITLNICKIYEKEKTKFPLNSIDGVFHHLFEESPKAWDNSKLNAFIQKYDGPSDINSTINALDSTIKGFRKRYKSELISFATFRHKVVAHSEYDFNQDELPSCDVMEKLFLFGADFYELISDSFVGVGAFDLTAARRVRQSLKRIFQELGLEDIKTDLTN